MMQATAGRDLAGGGKSKQARSCLSRTVDRVAPAWAFNSKPAK